MQLPLPLYDSVPLGTVTDRTGERFTLVAGLSRELVGQLVERSLDTSDVEIQQNTSDRERFGTGSYEAWYGKGRVPFALVHDATGKLAALAWYGPKPLGRKSLKHLPPEERVQDERAMDADNWHTVVYRSYPPYRGQGVMKGFVRETMRLYREAYPQARFWAGIHSENPASIGLATALGFVIDPECSNLAEHHTVMVESA